MKVLFCILGLLIACKSRAQTLTIDSMKIDELNNQLSIYSPDLDFNMAKVFVANTILLPSQQTFNGYDYHLPESGNGAAGNISIFSKGIVDTNWKITRWTEQIDYRHSIPGSLYYTNKFGVNLASYPPSESANYYFIFRTVSNRIALTDKSIQSPHLNKLSHATWDFNDRVIIPVNLFEDYSGSGNLEVSMEDSMNYVFSNNDSIFFSFGRLKKLACSYSYYYLARNKIVYASGNDTLSLDKQYFGLKMNTFGFVNQGDTLYKGEFWLGSYDSLAAISISWSNLNFESPYINPNTLSVSQAKSANFILYPNYPNPFAINTKIPFYSEEGDYITLEIVDPLGRISTIEKDTYDSGNHEIQFNAKDFSSGVYSVRIRTQKETFNHTLVIAK
jgi:hypothetical protein